MLTFFFDPVCPWAWRTSLWVREVRQVRPLDVQWKVFSLGTVNRDPLGAGPVELDPALRTLVLARRTGGNDAVDRLYLALGQARHDRREDLKSDSVIEAALVEAGLDRGLLRQALDDPSTNEEALAEHREATGKFDAFGVPWLVLDDQPFGFYGPVITEVPRGEAAAELWSHASWMLTQPYLYEFKRERG